MPQMEGNTVQMPAYEQREQSPFFNRAFLELLNNNLGKMRLC